MFMKKLYSEELEYFLKNCLDKPVSCIVKGNWILDGTFLIDKYGDLVLRSKQYRHDYVINDKLTLKRDLKTNALFFFSEICIANIKEIYIYKNNFERLISVFIQFLKIL